MTFDECTKSLKNVMHDEDGYEEYSEHHLQTVWNAATTAAAKISGNYVADDEIYPSEVKFANGRVVRVVRRQTFLVIE